jgi:hypothetical protein
MQPDSTHCGGGRGAWPGPKSLDLLLFISRYSHFTDRHRSKLLISHLHARRDLSVPVLPLLGLPVVDVHGCIPVTSHDVAAVAGQRADRELGHLRCRTPHMQHSWLLANQGSTLMTSRPRSRPCIRRA